MGADQKEGMRELVLRGGPWDQVERDAILDYCADDVDASAVVAGDVPKIDLPRALLRGRYMASGRAWSTTASRSTRRRSLSCDLSGLKSRIELIAARRCDFGVYDGRSFRGALRGIG